MPEHHGSFAGSVPANYDRYLGPMFFEPYAADLAKRLDVGRDAAVLELAAGTGILTRQLLAHLSRHARLIATDPNEEMLAIAKRNTAEDARLEWRTADAAALPFDDRSFDAVVCQFGIMFFPDQPRALHEARRVLQANGQLLFNVWTSLTDNPIAAAAHEAVAGFFHTDPPQFFLTPFGMHDQAMVEGLLRDAGFSAIACETVDLPGTSPTAEAAAKGLVLGTPLIHAIEERGSIDPNVIVHAVATRLAHEGGSEPMTLPMRARIFSARA